MAQTVTLKGTPKVPGAAASQTIDWKGDTSYPNPAGYVLTPSSFGFSRIQRVVAAIPATVAAAAWEIALVPTWDATNDYIVSLALHLIVSSTGVEVANAVNVSNADFTIVAEGN